MVKKCKVSVKVVGKAYIRLTCCNSTIYTQFDGNCRKALRSLILNFLVRSLIVKGLRIGMALAIGAVDDSFIEKAEYRQGAGFVCR